MHMQTGSGTPLVTNIDNAFCTRNGTNKLFCLVTGNECQLCSHTLVATIFNKNGVMGVLIKDVRTCFTNLG